MLFALFYYLLALVVFLLLLVPIIYKSFQTKYKESLPARFFLKNNPPFNSNSIHFHSCSLGEVRALKPIIKKLKTEINISTTTNTGMSEAKKLTKNVRFLPYEIFLPFWVEKQKVVVVLEAELWFMLFFIAKLKGSKTILLNARISDRSYKSYKRFSFFYKQIFKYVDKVFAQSDEDAIRLKELGAKNIEVIGNIKVFQNIEVTTKYKKPDKKVITIASSHDREELLLLKSIKNIEDYHVIIVPRHPERFDTVSKELDENGYYHVKFSHDNTFCNDITLVDTMGELINIYAITDIVLLGGSFVPNIGGHNPLEPAFFNTKIISGNYYFNQKALFQVVENIEICSDLETLNQLIDNAHPTTYNKELDLNPLLKELLQ